MGGHFGRVIKVSHEKMSIGDGRMNLEHKRVARAASDRLTQMLDSGFRIAEKKFDPAAYIPGGRQIGIELERALNKNRTGVQVAGYDSDRVCSLTKSNSVALSELRGASSQGRTFSGLLCRIHNPAVGLALDVAVGRH